jgi:hypothetical protein
MAELYARERRRHGLFGDHRENDALGQPQQHLADRDGPYAAAVRALRHRQQSRGDDTRHHRARQPIADDVGQQRAQPFHARPVVDEHSQ